MIFFSFIRKCCVVLCCVVGGVLAFNNVLEAGCLDTGGLIYIEELLNVPDIDSFGTTTARHKEGRFG